MCGTGTQLKCPQVPGESRVGAVEPMAHKIKVNTNGSNSKHYAYRAKSAPEVGLSGRSASAQGSGGGGGGAGGISLLGLP